MRLLMVMTCACSMAITGLMMQGGIGFNAAARSVFYLYVLILRGYDACRQIKLMIRTKAMRIL